MLSADETKRLDRLTFGNAAVTSRTGVSGNRLARVRGFSTEFHDFRPYQAGDDPRAVEWMVYARLGQLVTRTYRTSAQVRVHLLLDISASMSIGVPDKLSCAAKLAAILAYAALRGRDTVALATFNDAITQRIAPANGRPQLFRVFSALGQAVSVGGSAIAASLMNYACVESGPGLVVVISDFFDPNNVTDGLHYLLHRGFTPALVQVLAIDDLDPAMFGPYELVDAESPEATPVVVDETSLGTYKMAFDTHVGSLRAFCNEHALPFLQLASTLTFADMLRECARAGLFLPRG